MAKKNKNKTPQSRQIDAQKRRDKRRNKRESKDDCDPDMKIQLEKIGLGLKEVEGDGNCLFRALADQLYGSQDGKKHYGRLRKDTVDYMRRCKEDFEPFFASDEGIDFERHLELLAEDGTYAGNDAIVAFARRYEVVVVIHQLNEALWKIGDDDENSSLNEKSKKKAKRRKQLHISYHNGDHYNSVRRISDIKGPNCYHEANKPANIFIDTLQPEEEITQTTYISSEEETNNFDKEEDKSQYSSRENVSSYSSNIQRHNTLSQSTSIDTACKIRSTLWQEGGTGNRIFGDEVAESASRTTSQQHKKGNKNSKRKKANERRRIRQRNGAESSEEDSESKRCEPLAAMQTLSI